MPEVENLIRLSSEFRLPEILYLSLDLLKQRLAVQDSSKGQ